MAKLIDADTFANSFCESCSQEACEGCYENENMKCEIRRMLELALEDEDELVCHCNVKENAELICKIMDADVDNKLYDEAHDGCLNCKFINTDGGDDPCRLCKHNYMDMFKPMSHPHWVIVDRIIDICKYKCSECGGIVCDDYPYCPHCGADMRGDNHE